MHHIIGYVYDDENKMKKLTEADGTVSSNTYFADGLRRSRIKAGGTVTFVWDGRDYLMEY